MKHEIVFSKKNIPMVGISLGNMYFINNRYRIQLQNYGYIPLMREFYFNNHIHLSKKVVRYLNNHLVNQKLIDEMQKLGISKKEDIVTLLTEYETFEEAREHIKQKLFILPVK